MSSSPTSRRDYAWLGLFALCMLAFSAVQDHWRPQFGGRDPILDYFLGVAPNFFPGLGLPAFFVVLLPTLVKGSRLESRLPTRRHLVANAISLAGLLIWECLQVFTARGHFDVHDVWWTLIGGAFFHLLWGMWGREDLVQ